MCGVHTREGYELSVFWTGIVRSGVRCCGGEYKSSSCSAQCMDGPRAGVGLID
jgi:hypothetical protein